MLAAVRKGLGILRQGERLPRETESKERHQADAWRAPGAAEYLEAAPKTAWRTRPSTWRSCTRWRGPIRRAPGVIGGTARPSEGPAIHRGSGRSAPPRPPPQPAATAAGFAASSRKGRGGTRRATARSASGAGAGDGATPAAPQRRPRPRRPAAHRPLPAAQRRGRAGGARLERDRVRISDQRRATAAARRTVAVEAAQAEALRAKRDAHQHRPTMRPSEAIDDRLTPHPTAAGIDIATNAQRHDASSRPGSEASGSRWETRARKPGFSLKPISVFARNPQKR